MEMHQVRYFLAVARVLNFTRAADECNVAQPSLTRAIKQLEAELGGDLFRRERPAAQLTELGQRMHPLLQQCYDAASGARALASSFKSGEVGALRIALTHSIDLSLLIPHLDQIKRQFNRLEFRFLRGTSHEVGEFLKKGEAELGIAAEIGEDWDRLDTWPLFTESFDLVVNKRHPLADRDGIGFEDLRNEQLLSRNYCEHAGRLNESLREHGIDVDRSHEISSERDLIKLLEADIGFAVLPHTADDPGDPATRQRRRAGRAAHRASLRRRRAPAHRGGIRRDADAARRGLAAIFGEDSLAARGLALPARAPQRGQQIIDLHPLAEIGIDEAGLHQPVPADHEGRGDRQHPAVVAVEIRQILRQQALDLGAEPDREIERKRIAVVEIGQHRKRRTGLGFELFGVLLHLRHDGDDLAAGGLDPVHRLDHRPHIQPAIGTPVAAVEHHGDRSIGRAAISG